MTEHEQQVRDSLARDKAKLQDDQDALERRLAEAQPRIAQLDAEEGKAWKAYEDAGEPQSGATYDAWDDVCKARHRAVIALGKAYDRRKQIAQLMEALDTPEEFQRRLEVKERLSSLKTKGEVMPKEEKPCACGCGGLTKSTYLPGHDARHKSHLIDLVLNQNGTEAAKAAEQTLKDRNWTKFLERKREVIAAKDAKAAKKVADKAKAKSKAAKKDSTTKATSKKADDDGQVDEVAAKRAAKPDPKPARKPRSKRPVGGRK